MPDALRPYLPGWAWLESFALDIDGQELVAEPRRIADGGKVDEESVAWTAPLFMSKVLARFPEDAKAGCCPWTWIMRTRGDDATAKIGPFRLPVELGVDVGASDNGDFTVIRERRGMRAGRRWTARSSDPEKAQTRKRLGRSPDDADALLLAFWVPLENKAEHVQVEDTRLS